MKIVEVSTGTTYPIDVIPLEEADYKSLSKARYFFDWKKEEEREVYKLLIRGQSDILGLVSIERIPSEWRIHIRLLTVSVENKGKMKKYERIAANLITHIAKMAVADFGELACVSLKPKSSIAKHYIDTYNMRITGATLSIEVPEIITLINEYDHE